MQRRSGCHSMNWKCPMSNSITISTNKSVNLNGLRIIARARPFTCLWSSRAVPSTHARGISVGESSTMHLMYYKKALIHHSLSYGIEFNLWLLGGMDDECHPISQQSFHYDNKSHSRPYEREYRVKNYLQRTEALKERTLESLSKFWFVSWEPSRVHSLQRWNSQTSVRWLSKR
jgi:hypothetical protein